MPFTWTRRPVAWAAAIVPVMSMVAAMSAVRNIGSSWFDGLQSASNDERGNRHGDRAPRLSLLNCFERPGAHLAAAQIAVDQHTARRAVRVRQGEGRRLCVVGEQALAAPEHDGINQKPKLVDQPGCKQLAHHIPATHVNRLGPSWCLSVRIASARSPLSAWLFCQASASDRCVATCLGTLLNRSAMRWLPESAPLRGQYAANIS